MARREPVIRLNSVDLPTFGRPTSTTDGIFLGIVERLPSGPTGRRIGCPAQ
jgi:hypothetical protein